MWSAVQPKILETGGLSGGRRLVDIAARAGFDSVDLRLSPATPTDRRYTTEERITLCRGLKPILRDAGIPFEVPRAERLDERTDAVLAVVYLLFTAGYSPIGDGPLVRGELCDEAIRLQRQLCHLMPQNAEARGQIGRASCRERVSSPV